jgi:GntR family transcriptional regulator
LGELRSGDQLPPERELAEQAGISRMTARQAVAHLVREGELVVRPGIGTFVAEPKLSHDPLHLLSFTEETMRRGGSASSRVLEQAVVSPPQQVADGLALGSGETACRIVRLRSSGGIPLLLETSYVPSALCPGLEREDLAAGSLYDLLERRCGVRLEKASQTLEATVANEYESGLLDVPPGTSMLLLEGVAYSDRGVPAEYFKAVYRGDRFKFELESRRDARAAREVPVSRLVSVLLG